MTPAAAEEAKAKPVTEEATDLIREVAKEIAASTGVAMADAMAKARGVVTRRPKNPSEWPKAKIPNRVPAGYAVVCDEHGNGMKVLPVTMVAKGQRGTLVNYMEGMGESHSPGQLADSTMPDQGQPTLIVVQYTPVPRERADGQPVLVKGNLAYPGKNYVRLTDGPAPWDTTYYHPVYGAQFYEAETGKTMPNPHARKVG